MPKFQLIVRGEEPQHTAGDSIVIDMNASTIEEAREEAKWRLRGDPALWSGGFAQFSRADDFRLYLDPEDKFYGRAGHCVVLDREEDVHSATIVELHEAVDLKSLRDEIRDFKVEEKRRAERARDEAELQRLQQKLGPTP
jgi:hypothetical protein